MPFHSSIAVRVLDTAITCFVDSPLSSIYFVNSSFSFFICLCLSHVTSFLFNLIFDGYMMHCRVQ